MAIQPSPQFTAAAYNVSHTSGNSSGEPQVASGTPQEVMGHLAATGHLVEKYNKKPVPTASGSTPEGSWSVKTTVGTRPGAKSVDVATKEGRREAAGRLGLPNVKKKRKK